MGWTYRIISTLRVSGSSVHVFPRGTTHPCRNSRAHNTLKKNYWIDISFHGRCPGDVWWGNRLCCWTLTPSRIWIDPGTCGIAATMSMSLIFLATTLQLVTPTAVELSAWIGDLVWCHAISISVWRSGIMFLAMMKSLASSASTAEDMKNLMIWDSVRTGPLSLGIGSSSNRKMDDPDWLCYLDSLRQAVSEWAHIIISLTWYTIPSLGYLAT